MARYEIGIVKQITEHMTVTIEADHPEHAEAKIVEMLNSGKLDGELDNGDWSFHEIGPEVDPDMTQEVE